MEEIKINLEHNPPELGKTTKNTVRYDWAPPEPEPEKVEKLADLMEISKEEAKRTIQDREKNSLVTSIYIQKGAFENPEEPPRRILLRVSEAD